MFWRGIWPKRWAGNSALAGPIRTAARSFSRRSADGRYGRPSVFRAASPPPMSASSALIGEPGSDLPKTARCWTAWAWCSRRWETFPRRATSAGRKFRSVDFRRTRRRHRRIGGGASRDSLCTRRAVDDGDRLSRSADAHAGNVIGIGRYSARLGPTDETILVRAVSRLLPSCRRASRYASGIRAAPGAKFLSLPVAQAKYGPPARTSMLPSRRFGYHTADRCDGSDAAASACGRRSGWCRGSIRIAAAPAAAFAGALRTIRPTAWFCERIFKRRGHEVVLAHDGSPRLWPHWTRSRLDAAIIDLKMPEMSGFHVAKLYRQMEATGDRLPLIGLTADPTSETERRQCREAGMGRRADQAGRARNDDRRWSTV